MSPEAVQAQYVNRSPKALRSRVFRPKGLARSAWVPPTSITARTVRHLL